MSEGILHHHALGIHPGAFVQSSAPHTSDVQDGVLWVDTSIAPPYQLKVWDEGAGAWRAVGTISGVDGSGHLATACLTFPNGQEICGDLSGVLRFLVAGAELRHDSSGVQIPGGHRLEEHDPYSGGSPSATFATAGFERALSWSFAGTPAPGYGAAGRCFNGSSYAAGMMAPEGTHMAYLISDGRLSQTLDIPATGIWLIGFLTRISQYGNPGVLGVTLPLYLDIDGVQYPSGGNAFVSATSMWFTTQALVPLNAGRHTLRVRGAPDGFGSAGPQDGRLVVLVDAFFIQWSSGPAPSTRLRLHHSALGTQVDLPFPAISATPTYYLGQDPSSGLPAWAALAVATPAAAPAADVPAGNTLAQIQCGMAQAMATELESLYNTVAGVARSVAATLVGAAIDALAAAIDAALIAGEITLPFLVGAIDAEAMATLLATVYINGQLAPLTTAGDQQILKSIYCTLVASGGTAITDSVIADWGGNIQDNAAAFSSEPQAQLVSLCTHLHSTANWSQYGHRGAQTPSTACGSITCP
jgi:hypothetical protein